MENQTYNGWTNYATWRINLEYGFTDNSDNYMGTDAEELKEIVEDSLEDACSNDKTLSYALAFVSDVNWDEIARHIEENQEEEA